jgi:hypothetical protein
MAFKGALREFDVASIFQFVRGQQQSGRLDLKSDGKIGWILFSHGEIVLAGDTENSLHRIVIQYLIAKGDCDSDTITQLLEKSRKDLLRLLSECQSRKLLQHEELTELLQQGLVDICCNLFTWQSGTYEFRDAESTVEMIFPGLVLDAEFVMMEAMRRLDEWKEYRSRIPLDTIFKPNENSLKGKKIQHEGHNPLRHPAVHLLMLMDGEHSVEDLLKKSFLLEFRLYEVLDRLLQREVIMALSYNELQRIEVRDNEKYKEEIPEEGAKKARTALAVLFGLLLVFVIIRIIFFDGIPLISQILDKDPVFSRLAKQKTAIARIQYEAIKGIAPAKNTNMLSDPALLELPDIYGE